MMSIQDETHPMAALSFHAFRKQALIQAQSDSVIGGSLTFYIGASRKSQTPKSLRFLI